ncbi:Asp-tRNA(Asn)/Glu-tRNA(Gln) amidotransferase subunit GatA [Candidatus Woesearchaeota archaeon]|nr:MAG: Asp-tRNA(Asn)/Glu-tRNA(Gln) amidotransferase subunit GatA [Candidatus Woesearchaeota archaeon]
MTPQQAQELTHCFSTLQEMKPTQDGPLSGVTISLKDAICAKGMETTASSRILKGYKPLINATVVEKVLAAGATIIGKTIQDEFGFGGFCVNTGLDVPIPKNPVDQNRSCGGSSGGAGAAAKLIDNHVALGESTGGSIVVPAAFCGVYGFAPTYSRVSRYGLLSYGNSLDKIGPLSKDPELIIKTLNVIMGYDEKDSTSSKKKVEPLSYRGVNGLTIGVLNIEGVHPEIVQAMNKKIDLWKQEGACVKEINLPLTKKYSLATYYILAMSEASTNLAKYCGMRYGMVEPLEEPYNEYFTKVRSKHFGKEAKRRIILGTFARMAGQRDAFYIKAARVRTEIINEYKKAFEEVDVIVSATSPMFPPTFDEIEKLTPLQHYLADQLVVGPNLAGLPHMNVPLDTKLPSGLLVIGNHFEEDKVVQFR